MNGLVLGLIFSISSHSQIYTDISMSGFGMKAPVKQILERPGVALQDRSQFAQTVLSLSKDYHSSKVINSMSVSLLALVGFFFSELVC